MSKTILVIGAFDTKGEEYKYVIDTIKARGHQVLSVNTGVLGSTDLFPVDVEADRVAGNGNGDLEQLRQNKDRGEAMKVMCAGAAATVKQLHAENTFDGIFGMGGTGGSTVVCAAMRELPFGFPKLCVSTTAGGDVSAYVGTRDITMMPSIVDVAGLNRISKMVFSRAAGAICGMADTAVEENSADEKPIIAASMFGNTTECVDDCREQLTAKGYEVLVFHCTGTGGRTMEALVEEGLVDKVLDITTTEWADTICGGVFDAGDTRLDAAGKAGVPHLIVPGCIDMANFGGPETIPDKYKGRLFYEWNPSVTLMRTNKDENYTMGQIFAEKANAAKSPVAFLIPTAGLSILDSKDDDGNPQLFWDPKADQAFLEGLKSRLNPDIPVEEMSVKINDQAFARRAVEKLLELDAVSV